MTSASIGNDVIRELAVEQVVCVRPVMRRVIDRATGRSTTVPIPCGATRESMCPSCATKARRLRMTQCAEGWHAESEPVPLDEAGVVEPVDHNEEEELNQPEDEETSRQTRSTRRRSDAPDLPTRPVEKRTVGQVFTAPDGRTYRPSMFITLALPSYGKVIPGTGRPGRPGPVQLPPRRPGCPALPQAAGPLDPEPAPLRRLQGPVGAVEAQRRLAPHFHNAVRGAIPRTTVKTVTKATYLQLWWPQVERPVYVQRLPLWDGENYRDPDTEFGPNTTMPAWSWPPSSRPAAGAPSTTAPKPSSPAPIHLWTTVRQPSHRCRPRPEQRRQT